ncbi:MAG: hypothetical protein WBA02_15270 [Jannaschia helgolandensis]|uniref:hypothetical protein n=1 Tax=Jannaschia helgolandensis TaxID=188906 RepID=UPI003C77B6A1
MARLLFLFLLLSGCAWFRPKPVVIVPFVPGCTDRVALAQAVVDGRRRGQSRGEQQFLVTRAAPGEQLHRDIIESVYDWPRPTTPGDWTMLSQVTARAAADYCVNRPAQALQGRMIP